MTKIEYKNYDKLVEKYLNHDLPTYKTNHPLLPKHIFRMCLIGVSNSGKTNLLINMLDNLVDYDCLYIISETSDGINEYFQKLAEKSNGAINFFSNANDFNLEMLDPKKTNVIIFDDICHNTKAQEMIASCFSLGRHHSASIIYLSQSYFKLPVFVRNNTNQFLLFRLGQDSELGKIHQRLGTEVSLQRFKQMYEIAVKRQKYGFMYINLLADDLQHPFMNRFDGIFAS